MGMMKTMRIGTSKDALKRKNTSNSEKSENSLTGEDTDDLSSEITDDSFALDLEDDPTENKTKFDQMMSNDFLKQLYLRFLTQESNAELLLFVMDVELLKALQAKNVATRDVMSFLFAKYFVPRAPFELNLPAHIKTRLLKSPLYVKYIKQAANNGSSSNSNNSSNNNNNNSSTATPVIQAPNSENGQELTISEGDENTYDVTAFEEVYGHVKYSLQTDSFHRFTKSTQYLNYERENAIKSWLANKKLTEIAFEMSKPYTGVKLFQKKNLLASKNKRKGSYFTGSQAVDWIVKYAELTDRSEAVQVAARLLKMRVISPLRDSAHVKAMDSAADSPPGSPLASSFSSNSSKSSNHNRSFEYLTKGFVDSESELYRFTKKKRVVIVGGGFAGSLCAKLLEKDYAVTLVDTKPHFECNLAGSLATAEPSYLENTVIRHSEYLASTTVMVGKAIELAEHSVRVEVETVNTTDSASSTTYMNRTIPFDYLVIATGGVPNLNFPIIQEEEQQAMQIVYPHITSSIMQSWEKLEKAKSVAIIGGGPLGIEVLCAIAFKYPKKRIHFISKHENLIERCKGAHAKLVGFIKKHFNNVNLLLHQRVSSIEGRNICIVKPDGTTMILHSFDMAYICTGTKANCQWIEKEMPHAVSAKGIRVNAYFQVAAPPAPAPQGLVAPASQDSVSGNAEPTKPNHLQLGQPPTEQEQQYYNHIFAVGDVCDTPEEKLAEAAEDHARVIAKNLELIDYSIPRSQLQDYEVPTHSHFTILLGPNHAMTIKGDEAVIESSALQNKMKQISAAKKLRNIVHIEKR